MREGCDIIGKKLIVHSEMEERRRCWQSNEKGRRALGTVVGGDGRLDTV